MREMARPIFELLIERLGFLIRAPGVQTESPVSCV